MRRTIILAAALAIIVLGLWGTAVIYFDEARLKGIVSDRLSEQVGRRVEIVGALRFSIFPRPEVDARDVIIAGAEGDESGPLMRAQRVSTSLRLLPLLQGRLAPEVMALSGAVIQLDSVDSSGEGSRDPLETIRSGARALSGRSLSLRDLTLVMPSRENGAPRRILVEFVELDRFSLDRPVAFRFRGDLGEPTIMSDMSVDGVLNVPASPGTPVRLRDVDLMGELTALGSRVTLSGDLTLTPDSPFRVSLAGGRVSLGGSAFDVSFSYQGGDAPAADLLFSGRELDWLGFDSFTGGMGVDPATLLAGLSSRVDIRSQLQFDRMRLGSMVFSDARVDLRSQSAGLGVNLAAAFPGGFAEASGVLTGEPPESLAVDVSLAEFDRSLEWLQQPVVVEGSGQATLSLSWPLNASAAYELNGSFELWDGRLQLADSRNDSEVQAFDRFSGEFRATPGYLEVPGFEVEGEDLSGGGWAAVNTADGALAGEIRPPGQPRAHLALSGTLAEARMTPVTPAAAEEESNPAAEEDEAPDP
jgi:hypothetical protein